MAADSSDNNGVIGGIVSKKVGVVVAMGVIVVAAAVGYSVLGIGGDSGPDATFEATEDVVAHKPAQDASPAETMRVTRVTLSHTGGTALWLRQTQIRHEGNESVYARKNGEFVQSEGFSNPLMVTQPNVCETVGDSGRAEWGSGEVNRVLFSGGGEIRNTGNPKNRGPLLSDAAVVKNRYCQGQIIGAGTNAEKNRIEIHYKGPESYEARVDKIMQSGDTVSVVWEAASGEEEQTLFEHTVEQDSPTLG
jgi:hypothetical protein